MDPEITDTVTEWEPVAGQSGYAGLRTLADDEFSGAVTAGPTWAFLLNGRIVGVFDGDVEAFADAEFTAYEAPEPALALLFAMRQTGGETRARYYTNDTPLTEVDRTLSDGNFTGYVELSENVLSGDYYVVYHGGRSTSVAYVGASRRLVTGDEAFDLAADEVGIYAVTPIDVEVVEVPEAESEPAADPEPEPGPDPGQAAEPSGETGDAVGTDEADTGPGTDADGTAPADGRSVTFGDAGGADETGDPAGPERPGTTAAGDDQYADGEQYADDGSHTARHGDGTRGPDEPEPVGADHGDGADTGGAPGEADGPTHSHTADGPRDGERADDTPTGIGREATNGGGRRGGSEAGREGTDGAGTVVESEPGSHADTETETDTETGAESAGPPGDGDGDSGVDREGRADRIRTDTDSADGDDTDDVFTAERRWRETHRIPAVDPDESMDPEPDVALGGDADPSRSDGASGPGSSEVPGTDHETTGSGPDPASARPADEDEETSTTPADAAGAAVDGSDAELRSLGDALAAAEAERDELAATVDDLETRLEAVGRERDEYRERIAELEAEIERLRERIDRSEPSDGGESGGTTNLSAAAARDGTNLFVRYRSKGKPTLTAARAGDAPQEEVVENLRLEYHTSFDDGSTTVDGEPYGTFLHGTTEWGFVRWVVEDLLYEIGRSGHRSELAGVFDRIPEIDRVQFNGEVPVTVEEDGERSHGVRAFDLVFWDSMGDPLFVANVDASRDATTAGAVESLIEGARAVGGSKDTLGGAFVVSTSFFEPEALDAVGEATGGGLLSRNAKRSFVRLSRKRGFHLGLVEARDGEFHLSVPEL
jgi:hypothetical protein